MNVCFFNSAHHILVFVANFDQWTYLGVEWAILKIIQFSLFPRKAETKGKAATKIRNPNIIDSLACIQTLTKKCRKINHP